MSRAYSGHRRVYSRHWHTFVWLAIIAVLLALRFTPPDLTSAQGHQVLLKKSAARDKRPCVQRPDTEFDSNSGAPSFAPALAALDFLRPHSSSKARESNAALCNRPPPLV